MRVRVDDARCQGHTQCTFIAPDLFASRDEDGHSEALVEEVPAGSESLAELAAASCPERAIVIEEDV
jgi:ferredoxin